MTERPNLATWVGKQQRSVDWLTPTRLAAWNVMLDLDVPFPQEGDPAPPSFHWTLFPPLERQSQLGADGAERRGGFLPPVALPRRMWAGSRLTFHQPILVGERLEKISVIEKIEEKSGRAGALVFVTVRHTISGSRGAAVEEEQDIVYREAEGVGSASPGSAEPAPVGAWSREIVPTDVLLFRYSALTFNGYRIHYDRRYVTLEQGYPGLVVHGPLLATLLLDLARRQLPSATVTRFRFRGIRPTFDTSPFEVRGGPGEAPGHVRLWSTDNQGRVGVEAEAWVR